MVYTAISDSAGTISQFTRKKPLVISHSGALTAYQKMVTVAYEPGMLSNFGDIRFAAKDGTYIPYWVEKKTDGDNATVWFKANFSDGDTIVWLYYGNTGLSSGSSGADTFPQYQGQTAVAFKLANVIGSTDSHWRIKYSKGATTNEYIGASNSASFATDDSIYMGLNPAYIAATTTINEGTGTQNAPAGTGATTNIYDIYLDVGVNAKFYRDGTLIDTITTNLPNENMGMKLQDIGAGGSWEWGFGRNYAATEPTSVWGAAQHQRRVPTFL